MSKTFQCGLGKKLLLILLNMIMKWQLFQKKIKRFKAKAS